MSTATAEPEELAAFRLFSQELRVETGAALELYPEQFEVLTPFFEGVTETLILLPKKNGKSTMIAALCLYHLMTEPFADAIVVASSRDQAKIILDQAKMFIRQAPGLRKRMTVKEREITYAGGRVRILASDQDTVDGQLPSLAIVDELHRQRSGELRTVLRLGLGPRKGKMLVISTAGYDVLSPLGQLRRKAQMMDSYIRDPETRRATARSKTFAYFEWGMNRDDDPNDFATVKLVNPAPWKTLETLAEDREATPSDFEWLRLVCNVWTEGEEPWLAPRIWNELLRSVEPEEGARVSVGIRVGMGHQSAAVVWVHKLDDVYQASYHLITGDTVIGDTEDFVRELNTRYSVRFNAYVSKTFDRSADILSDEGLTLVAYPIGTRTMDMAETLLKVIGDKRLAHEGPGPFTDQVMAGQTKVMPAGWRFVDRPAGHTPVDALYALAAAVHVAETEQPVTPLFAWT